MNGDRFGNVAATVPHRRYVPLFAAVTANFTQLSARIALSPLIPYIIGAYGITKSEVGVALTIMWMMYALLQFPSGVLSDRFGERRVILVALTAIAVGSLLLYWSSNFAEFVVAVLLLGVSAGLYFTAGASLLARKFDDTGWALGCHTSGSAVGGLVAPAVAVFVAAQFGWRTATLIGAALAVPVIIAIVLFVEPTPPTAPNSRMRERFQLTSIRGLLLTPSVAFTALLGAVGSFSFQAFASFFPTFLFEFAGFSEETAGLLFSVVFFVGALSLPTLGSLSDTHSRDTVLLVALGSFAMGLTFVLLGGSTLTVGIGVLLLGVGLAWGGIVQARLMDVLSSDDKGAGFGLIRSSYVFIGAFGSVVTGILADAYGWLIAYGAIVVLLVIAGSAVVGSRFRPHSG